MLKIEKKSIKTLCKALKEKSKEFSQDQENNIILYDEQKKNHYIKQEMAVLRKDFTYKKQELLKSQHRINEKRKNNPNFKQQELLNQKIKLAKNPEFKKAKYN